MNTILRNVLEVSKNGEVWEKYDNFDLNKTSLIFAYKHNIFLGKVRSAKFVIFITAFFIPFIFSYVVNFYNVDNHAWFLMMKSQFCSCIF